MAKRVITIQDLISANVPKVEFSGEFREAFGTPEARGVWYVFGRSGSGKTTFTLELMKELSYTGKVLFVSYEEGAVSQSLQVVAKRIGLLERQGYIYICEDRLDDLRERLNKRNSYRYIVIDSLEHSEFTNVKQIQHLANDFPSKLFIFIGQATGNRPRTELGESVLFLAKQKIYIEGYRAFSRGRSMGEKEFYTIWDKGSEKYWDYK
ncbi:MAG TPA: AAA family ATPase [Fermentimonas sp.]|nr:AAA family ATPase [Fermentimonas sp.]